MLLVLLYAAFVDVELVVFEYGEEDGFGEGGGLGEEGGGAGFAGEFGWLGFDGGLGLEDDWPENPLPPAIGDQAGSCPGTQSEIGGLI